MNDKIWSSFSFLLTKPTSKMAWSLLLRWFKFPSSVFISANILFDKGGWIAKLGKVSMTVWNFISPHIKIPWVEHEILLLYNAQCFVLRKQNVVLQRNKLWMKQISSLPKFRSLLQPSLSLMTRLVSYEIEHCTVQKEVGFTLVWTWQIEFTIHLFS